MISKFIVIGLSVSLTMLAPIAHAFESFFGDENVKAAVKQQTSKIYETRDKSYFFLTKKSLQAKSTCGTDIVAHENKRQINRIITKSCTRNGRLSVEYYYENGQSIFVYEVFEYYSEKAKKDTWVNFKNIPSWESRYYFSGQTLGYHSHKGRVKANDSTTGASQLARAESVLRFTKSKIQLATK